MEKVLFFSALILLSSNAISNSTDSCFRQVGDDYRLSQLKGKVSFYSATQQTFSMLVNDTHPTEQERNAVLIWGQLREECLEKYPPPSGVVATINMNGFKSIQALIAELYQGNLTYGQFAKNRQEIAKVVDAELRGLRAQYQASQQPSGSQQPQYGQPKPYKPPVTTSCKWDRILQQMDCTTPQ